MIIDILSGDSPTEVALKDKFLPSLAASEQIPGAATALLIEIGKSQTAVQATRPDSASAPLHVFAMANYELRPVQA